MWKEPPIRPPPQQRVSSTNASLTQCHHHSHRGPSRPEPAIIGRARIQRVIAAGPAFPVNANTGTQMTLRGGDFASNAHNVSNISHLVRIVQIFYRDGSLAQSVTTFTPIAAQPFTILAPTTVQPFYNTQPPRRYYPRTIATTTTNYGADTDLSSAASVRAHRCFIVSESVSL